MNQRLISDRFPYLPFRVRFQTSGREIEIEAFIDIGFDGALVLPSHLIAVLESSDLDVRWRLADDSEVTSPSYLALIELIGFDSEYPVVVSLLGTEAVVGRGFTDGFSLLLDHGRQVIVEP